MKSTTLLLALCGLITAATTLTAAYTKNNARIPRMHIKTEFSGNNGTASAVHVDVMVESILVNEADSEDALPAARGVVHFDLLDPALTATNITAAGKTVTYPQLAALLRQASLDRANAAGID